MHIKRGYKNKSNYRIDKAFHIIHTHTQFVQLVICGTFYIYIYKSGYYQYNYH